MDQDNLILTDADWFAADLDRYCETYNLKLYSIHDLVINFQVDTWPHLLMVAGPALEQGPAAVGLGQRDFELFKATVEKMNNGWFEPSEINIASNDRNVSVNWHAGNCADFTPPRLSGYNLAEIKAAAKVYRELLKTVAEPSASAVLLDLPGGEDYFRHEISCNYPLLVDSLLAGKDEKFVTSCRAITGMGRGFSPTGDDLIHGALIAFNYFSYDHNFAEKITGGLAETAALTNAMGGHMLDTGIRGLTPVNVQAFITSIAANKPDYLTLDRLLKIGSNTGYDLAAALLCYIFRMTESRSD